MDKQGVSKLHFRADDFYQDELPRPRVAIIADDLTGALDAASPFADRGLATVVCSVSDLQLVAGSLVSAQVISITTDSREIPEREAAARVALAARYLSGLLPDFVLKKIDSRLKGNLEAEVKACREEFARETLLVVPAIPHSGRIVRAGHIEGFGIENPLSVAASLGGEGSRANIPDTLRATDFEPFVEQALSADWLTVGARGISEAVARRIAGSDRLARKPRIVGPIMICVGSKDPISLRQLEYLEAAMARAEHGNDSQPIEIVSNSEDRVGELPAIQERRLVARMVERIEQQMPGTLLLSGGRTASLVLSKLGVRRIDLGGEMAQGMCWGTIDVAGRKVLLVTKSGGFGEPDLLARTFIRFMA